MQNNTAFSGNNHRTWRHVIYHDRVAANTTARPNPYATDNPSPNTNQ